MRVDFLDAGVRREVADSGYTVVCQTEIDDNRIATQAIIDRPATNDDAVVRVIRVRYAGGKAKSKSKPQEKLR